MIFLLIVVLSLAVLSAAAVVGLLRGKQLRQAVFPRPGLDECMAAHPSSVGRRLRELDEQAMIDKDAS